MIIYMRIQTNRAKIKDILSRFTTCAVDGEAFIAPRPQPREFFKYYYGYGRVSLGSNNYKLLTRLSNHSVIEEEEYSARLAEIEFFWKASSA